MTRINGKTFHEMPCMCGACPFFLSGRNDTMGFCTAFEKHKSRWANLPKRCRDLFTRAFELGRDDLVIVMKTTKNR